ncbi:MAG: TM2 domain-containing protein [Sandaracinaceae bacterium]|nr:TM2 domain-containing protein [Sandaracinaceae bacterium]MBK6807606.1 TM2 domain-containing protein [Sandaracinaceae bacterium]MBK7155264.1 TM2 domain-containing protein [Sandaracinaceae bacterium]MBK7774457.1 TM2 domain-containing protein [Sandaracinaceae bacterium]MBK8588606.1 TM2 domain-containing protein [Sandaracinaceae bacterium]
MSRTAESSDTHSTLLGYILWIFGFLGAHRFYFGKKLTGTLYFFTLGLLGIGWLIDLFLIPGMARSARQKYADGPVDYDISWLLLTFLGAFGIHRFYRGAWLTGLLYLCTGGLLFAGVVWDFWFLNEQCSARNMELARPAPRVERPVTF